MVAAPSVEEEVARVLAEYCRAFDARDRAAFLRLWHPEAVWRPRPDLEMVGVERIAEFIDAGWVSLTASVHVPGVPVVEVDGQRARAWSAAVSTTQRRDEDGRPVVAQSAVRYADELVCHEGSWVLRSRTTASAIRLP